MFNFDTEWAYKHLVIIVAGKTGEYTKNLEHLIQLHLTWN